MTWDTELEAMAGAVREIFGGEAVAEAYVRVGRVSPEKGLSMLDRIGYSHDDRVKPLRGPSAPGLSRPQRHTFDGINRVGS